MEHASVTTLLFITLLQICHQQQVPSWFSANVIKDGDYSPKPISEIFSTDSPFSTSNPIVVVQSSTPTSFGPFSSTTEEPSTSSSIMAGNSRNMAVMPLPQSSTIQPVQSPSTLPSSTPSTTPLTSTTSAIPSTTQQSNFSQGIPNFRFNLPPNFSQNIPNFPLNISPNFSQGIPSFPLNISPNFSQSIQNFPQNIPSNFSSNLSSIQFYNQAPVGFPRGPTFTSNLSPQLILSTPQPFQPQPITSIPQAFQPQQPTQNIQTPTTPPQPNYFVIYSPGPQAILGGSSTANQQILSTTSAPSGTTERPTTQSPCNTASASTPQPLNLLTVPPTTANFPRATSTQNILMPPNGGFSQGNGVLGNLPNGQVIQAGVAPNVKSLKIRLISPTGSLTKVKFVGPPTTTTKKPTTTRRPRTTRKPPPAKKDKRLNRNTYDDCMRGCPNSKRPICATPLGERPINADKLRGFPSICHMACHNSYNRTHYERVIEGRCGKLRTQIRLYGTDKKVKKDDLNKAQYSFDSDNSSFLQLTSFSANN